MATNYPPLGARDPRPQLGRNLTYGMLDSLGRAIVTGQYETEAFPTEAELAKQHGVSRSVTREAVKMLTAKGLLSARPRQGTVVRPASAWNLFDTDVLRWLLERQFTVELLRQFSQLRVAIEPEAAALAACFASDGDLEQISAGLARMQAAEGDSMTRSTPTSRSMSRSCSRRAIRSTRSSAMWWRPRCAPRSASPTGSGAAPASPTTVRCTTRSWPATPPRREPRCAR